MGVASLASQAVLHCEQPRLANGGLICSALRTVGVSIDTSGVVLVGFPIPWGAIDSNIENPASLEGWERRLNDFGFGDSLRRALGLRV